MPTPDDPIYLEALRELREAAAQAHSYVGLERSATNVFGHLQTIEMLQNDISEPTEPTHKKNTQIKQKDYSSQLLKSFLRTTNARELIEARTTRLQMEKILQRKKI